MFGKRIYQNAKGRVVGKGSDGGKPSSPGISAYTKPVKTQPTVSVPKLKEMASIPYIRIQDNNNLLPRYTVIASRSTDDLIGMDELDTLQAELENLLCTVALRTRVLQNEIENIDVNESKRDKRGKAANKQLQYPGKRKYPEEKPVKSKDNKSPVSQPKMAKLKNFTPVIAPVPAQGSFSNDNILVSDNSVKLEMPAFSSAPKNNTPYKFWTSIEPYCGPINIDDLKCIESLLATSSNIPPPPIPSLGKHYSEVWADENLSDDQLASNPNKHKSSGISSEATAMRKKGERLMDNMITGPLTQRLVSGLVEDNSLQYETPDIKIKQSPLKTPTSYKNSITLERCLRKELIEQGILDPEDMPPLTNPADDEILTDIKKCLAELNILRKNNTRSLRNLVNLCKQEMTRNELKKKLEQVDAEVTEIYKKHLIAKQKKRPLSKKEKDDAWRAINEQIHLNNEINSLPPIGPNA